MEATEKAKEKIQEIKGFLETLELQFSLGKADAIDEFEKYKKNLKTFIDETTVKFLGTEKGTQLKIKFEELELQLALGKAETKEALELQKEKINKSLVALKEELIEKYPNLIKEFDDKTFKIRSIMDTLKLQFALGTTELKDELEKNKNDISEKILTLKNKIETEKELAEGKIEGFKDEVSEAFSHIKKAIEKLK